MEDKINVEEALKNVLKKLKARGWLHFDFMYPRHPYEEAGIFPVDIPANAIASWNGTRLSDTATFKHDGHRCQTLYPIDTIRSGNNDTRLIVSKFAAECLFSDPHFPAIIIQTRDAVGAWQTATALPFPDFMEQLESNRLPLPPQSAELLSFIELAAAAGLPALYKINVKQADGTSRSMVDARRISFRAYPTPAGSDLPPNEWSVTADFHPNHAQPTFEIHGSGSIAMMGVGSPFMVAKKKGMDPDTLCPRPLSDILDRNVREEILKAMAARSGGTHMRLAGDEVSAPDRSPKRDTIRTAAKALWRAITFQ